MSERWKHYHRKAIELDLATVTFVGGEYPFFRIGNYAGECQGVINDVPTVRRLRRMCDEYLESRGKKP